MIHKARFTGELFDDKFVGVKFLEGYTRYARPCMPIALATTAAKDWFDNFGNDFFAIVAELSDESDEVYLLGVSPLDAKNPVASEGWNKFYALIAVSSRFYLDDENKLVVVDCLDANTKIKLGSKDADSPAVLGNKNVDVLKKLATSVQAILNALSSSPTVAQDGGSSYKAGIVAATQQAASDIQEILSSDADNTTSQTTYLK